MAAEATLDCVPTLDLQGGACFKSILVPEGKYFNHTSGSTGGLAAVHAHVPPHGSVQILCWDQAADVRIFSVRTEWPSCFFRGLPHTLTPHIHTHSLLQSQVSALKPD